MAEAENIPAADVEKSFSLPVGFASPLWLAFAGAAATGAAFFWMSRWARPINLEAKLAAELPAAPELAPEPAAILAPIQAAIVAAETVAQAAFEAVVEQSAAVIEALDPAEETIVVFDPVIEAPVEVAVEAVEPEPVVEAEPEPAVSATIDDLTRLVGVGPKLAVALAERGVTSFAQIAAWTADDLAEFDHALSLKGRAVRDAWVAQARRFAETAA